MDKADEKARNIVDHSGLLDVPMRIKFRDEIAAALRSFRDEALEPLQKIVGEQAQDDGLWFIAQYASESYSQQELRRLHVAIETLKSGGTP